MAQPNSLKDTLPLVSVLMPVFNVDRYVKDAINSILQQTYTNFELIIVDDGSQDNTLSIVNSFALKDDRIKVLSNSSNRNIVYSLNKAFRNSVGQFIFRMDGDDICEPDRLNNLMNCLDERVDIQLVGSSMTVIDDFGRDLGKSKFYSDRALLAKTLKYRTPVSHIWLARRDVYSALGGYRDIPGAEDYDFLLRMVTRGFKFTNLENDYTYSVRVGREGNTASMIGLRQYLLKKYVYRLYLNRIKSGCDDFSSENMERAVIRSPWVLSIHQKSQSFVKLAHNKWAQSKYFSSILMMALSCVSPYQFLYLFERISYSIVVFIGVRAK